MRRSEIRRVMRVLAARGGKARAKKLSPERRREIAVMASRAAARKRAAQRLAREARG